MIKLGGGIGGWGLGTGKARQRQGKARYVQAYPGMSRHVQAKERRGKSVKTGGEYAAGKAIMYLGSR